ncbi:hypothetical protein H4W81_008888 [Nonomuraea africana]|uniref:Uncharacterized protein n=1 Tax=Nonomuraea africana TaxID=46171 RepID=A0ABR9KVQ2_9ACTN|nr:hypothetical protein [Nonomuraea africana]
MTLIDRRFVLVAVSAGVVLAGFQPVRASARQRPVLE